jgi:hypothetical protein
MTNRRAAIIASSIGLLVALVAAVPLGGRFEDGPLQPDGTGSLVLRYWSLLWAFTGIRFPLPLLILVGLVLAGAATRVTLRLLTRTQSGDDRSGRAAGDARSSLKALHFLCRCRCARRPRADGGVAVVAFDVAT